jgi:hypothetical protein
MEETSKNNETAQLGIGVVIERNFTTKEVVALFQKLEEQRSYYYGEDACEILPLDRFLKAEGLIE